MTGTADSWDTFMPLTLRRRAAFLGAAFFTGAFCVGKRGGALEG